MPIGFARPDSIPHVGRALAGVPGDRRARRHGLDGDETPTAAPTLHVLWPEVRTIVMLGINYGPGDDPLAILQERARAAPSRSTPRAMITTR